MALSATGQSSSNMMQLNEDIIKQVELSLHLNITIF